MNKKQYELLSQIKDCYMKLKKGDSFSFQVKENGSQFSARQFYLEDLSDNLVRPMAEQHVEEYSRGSGSELDDKMKALRSSSAMAFNIIGNETCNIVRVPEGSSSISPGKYLIEYECQFPTLRFGLPANMDVFLVNGDKATIACEMKMLEWITSAPSPLKDKYMNVSNYIYNDTADVFVSAASKLNELHEHEHVFDHYDFSQMFKHSLALYNHCRAQDMTAHITLLNCVWEPPDNYDLSDETRSWIDDAIEREHEGYDRFQEEMRSIKDLFESQLNRQFFIEYLPVSELIEAVDYPQEEQRLIRRYR